MLSFQREENLKSTGQNEKVVPNISSAGQCELILSKDMV